MAEQTERWVTADDVAAHLAVTPYWVREMAKRGDLPATKIGNYWRFRISEVDDAMNTLRACPRTRA